MFRGLWKLTWLEIKIFLREPLGAFGSILFPVLVFVVVGRLMGGRRMPASMAGAGFGWMRWISGSTLGSTIMHAAYNLTLFLGFYAGGSKVPQSW